MTREEAIKFKEEIKAFQEGKTIQISLNQKIWNDTNDPSFDIRYSFRIKPEEKPEQKRIIELSDDGETWFEATSFIPKCEKLHARVRVETQQTKRLPTIEEVEKWFLENRVFILKTSNCMIRITSFTTTPCDSTEEYICIGGSWYTIQDFCKKYNHYDGSSLYITE